MTVVDGLVWCGRDDPFLKRNMVINLVFSASGMVLGFRLFGHIVL